MHKLHCGGVGSSRMIGACLIAGALAVFMAWIYVMLVMASPTDEERRLEDLEQIEFLKKWGKNVE